MYKSHLEIAKVFRHDPATGEYFYHLKTKWEVCDEVQRIDEWVLVSEEIFTFLRRFDWREFKTQQRASLCRKVNGTRCRGDCKQCPDSRNGLPLSLEQLTEDGLLPEDDFNIDDYIEQKELVMALHKAISSLDEKDCDIVMMWADGQSERNIAAHVNMSQRGVGYRKDKVIKKLRDELKDYQ